MSLAIEPHNFEQIPFVVHPNNHAADALLDDGHARMFPTNDCYTDRFVVHPNFAVDELAGLGAGFALVDFANELAVASTFVGFVDLNYQFIDIFWLVQPSFYRNFHVYF